MQEKTFERVGGSKPVKVDLRIIAATNRNLPEMIAKGLFREDLFYRLNVFPITIPPLRDRGSDVILLADHFVTKSAEEMGKDVKRISTPALNMLMAYHWPGNVRELENVIERSVILSDDGVIHGYNLPPSLADLDRDRHDLRLRPGGEDPGGRIRNDRRGAEDPQRQHDRGGEGTGPDAAHPRPAHGKALHQLQGLPPRRRRRKETKHG